MRGFATYGIFLLALLHLNPRSAPLAAEDFKGQVIVLAGEITTGANVDYIQVARDTIKRIGYDNTEYGIDYKGCAVLVAYDKQSPDIAQGVNKAYDDDLGQGAGDQATGTGLDGAHLGVTFDERAPQTGRRLEERVIVAGFGERAKGRGRHAQAFHAAISSRV